MKVKAHTRKIGGKTIKVKGHNRKGRGRGHKKNYGKRVGRVARKVKSKMGNIRNSLKRLIKRK